MKIQLMKIYLKKIQLMKIQLKKVQMMKIQLKIQLMKIQLSKFCDDIMRSGIHCNQWNFYMWESSFSFYRDFSQNFLEL